MSAIDEIMMLADDIEDMTITHHDGEGQEPIPQRAALRELIAAALADARREGAEQMREAAAAEFDRRDGGTGIGFYDPHEPAEIIRALPLPTWSQPAGAVPGEWIKWAGGECPIPDGVGFQFKFRDDSQNNANVHYNATEWDWSDCTADADIVAYRVLP